MLDQNFTAPRVANAGEVAESSTSAGRRATHEATAILITATVIGT
jgi:hypothetical protein